MSAPSFAVDDPRHGTRRGYDLHRHAGQAACDPCRLAAAKYEQQRQLDLMAGDPRRIDATGTRRRIQALARIGWAADSVGIGRDQVWQLTRQKYVLRTTAAKVAEVYERLCMTPGPSVVTRKRAEAKGWPPPLAWDDIDDASERPDLTVADVEPDPVVIQRILDGDWRLKANTAERLEVIRLWTGSLNELERRTGWNIHREVRSAA